MQIILSIKIDHVVPNHELGGFNAMRKKYAYKVGLCCSIFGMPHFTRRHVTLHASN